MQCNARTNQDHSFVIKSFVEDVISFLSYPPIGKGNFGEVFSAYDREGKLFAIKIMHESIFGNDDMLGGFRRGVRSMEIASTESLSGMVSIVAKFELPPTIVMPFVAGVSLEDALKLRPNLAWNTKLDIVIKTGNIIKSGHALIHTILHRDLKPSNIMIENFEYSGVFDPSIVVLYFDMSWHKGSRERDVVFESRDDFGYLAPEQTNAESNYSARSTKVDSYGFGMTMFYVFGIQAPRPNEDLSAQWLYKALRATRYCYDFDWRSAPSRLARLIVWATRIDQRMRCDFSFIIRSLEDLRQAILAPGDLENPELWAEEILARIAVDLPYEWDDTTGAGTFLSPTGLEISSLSDFRNRTVTVTLDYVDQGLRDKAGLSRYLRDIVPSTVRTLTSCSWTVVEHRAQAGDARIVVKCSVEQLKTSAPELIAAANQARQAFTFK